MRGGHLNRGLGWNACVQLLGVAREGRIQGDVASPSPVFGPPNGVLDHSDKGVGIERLRDRVDGPRLLDEVLANPVRLRAHEHDRRRAKPRVPAQRSTELKAVHSRHDKVDQDQIDRCCVGRFVEQLQRGLTVDRHDGIVPVPLEHGAHHLAYGRTVVDDENARSHEVRSARR